MLVDPKQKPYLLSQTQNQFLFSEQILPNAFDETAPAVQPKAIFLGGQPGSGKSGLSLALQRTFPDAERAVIINSDALREYHPDFSILQKTDADRASYLVNPDTRIWQKKLIRTAIENKRNLVLDGTLGGSPEPIKETVEELSEQGYFIQISVLAVPARLSRFGIYKRFEDQTARKGIGRWVGMANHDRVYNELATTLIVLESNSCISCIQIFTRAVSTGDFSLLYEKRRLTNKWQWPPVQSVGNWDQLEPVFKSLWDGRDCPWSTEEEQTFLVAVHDLAEQMRQRGVSQQDIDNFYRYVECTH